MAIQISQKHAGSFTAWCKSHGYGGVTKACIMAGKKAKSPLVRKRANFAYVAKYKWHK